MYRLFLQFMRYGIVGVLGLALYTFIFFALNETILPADAGEAAISRGRNYFFSNSIAFVFSTILVYLLNRHWVFQPGRHSMRKEAALFVLISIIAHLIGTPTGSYLVAAYNWNEYWAFSITVTISVLLNFTGRKLFVFAG